MEFTAEQREKIYLEEKSRREKPGSSGIEMLLIASAVIIGFAGFLLLIQKPMRGAKLEDLRKAYEGLPPEEE